MHITLITPATKYSKEGNRVSANRWAKFLRLRNHTVIINSQYTGNSTDLMIALHAWRSSSSIGIYRKKYPNGPLIVVIGGTDANTFLKTEPTITLRSLKYADAIVCLHSLIPDLIPSYLKHKLHVILQSAVPIQKKRKPAIHNFDVCVIAHLREEKDPFRAAKAVRLMPPSSKIRIFHLGKAHSVEWEINAKKEVKENSRYNWLGQVTRSRVREELEKTNLMIISSQQEGGANVISEAITADVPIIASDISGNIGLLGEKYPGYFRQGDEHSLAEVLNRAETDQYFLNKLIFSCTKLKKCFLPEKESLAWSLLIKNITKSK